MRADTCGGETGITRQRKGERGVDSLTFYFCLFPCHVTCLAKQEHSVAGLRSPRDPSGSHDSSSSFDLDRHSTSPESAQMTSRKPAQLDELPREIIQRISARLYCPDRVHVSFVWKSLRSLLLPTCFKSITLHLEYELGQGK